MPVAVKSPPPPPQVRRYEFVTGARTCVLAKRTQKGRNEKSTAGRKTASEPVSALLGPGMERFGRRASTISAFYSGTAVLSTRGTHSDTGHALTGEELMKVTVKR